MTFKFDFSVDAWISGVEIEAENESAAKDKLYSMSLQELIDEGYIKDFNVSDVDSECTNKTITAHVFDIDYDISPEDCIDESELETMTEGEIGGAVNEFKDGLGQGFEVTVEVNGDEDDMEDAIADGIFDMTGWPCTKFSYVIIHTK